MDQQNTQGNGLWPGLTHLLLRRMGEGMSDPWVGIWVSPALQNTVCTLGIGKWKKNLNVKLKYKQPSALFCVCGKGVCRAYFTVTKALHDQFRISKMMCAVPPSAVTPLATPSLLFFLIPEIKMCWNAQCCFSLSFQWAL